MACWNTLFDQARGAFAQQRTAERARTLALSALTCLGRRTLSGLLCTAGQQFRDWSAAYRLFERERLDSQALWKVPLDQVLQALPPARPVVALLDDTLLRKRGHHIAGTSWRRDPLGPHFADNFIWASRFLQISLALPADAAASASAARAIPIDLQHAPSPRKPSRRADAQQWQNWRSASAASRISCRRGRAPCAFATRHRSVRGRRLALAAGLCRRHLHQPHRPARPAPAHHSRRSDSERRPPLRPAHQRRGKSRPRTPSLLRATASHSGTVAS